MYTKLPMTLLNPRNNTECHWFQAKKTDSTLVCTSLSCMPCHLRPDAAATAGVGDRNADDNMDFIFLVPDDEVTAKDTLELALDSSVRGDKKLLPNR
jgi:hypothetical protein